MQSRLMDSLLSDGDEFTQREDLYTNSAAEARKLKLKNLKLKVDKKSNQFID